MNLKPFMILAVLPCAACSSIVEGPWQRIAVETDPAGASCTFMREGREIGTVDRTPNSVLIEKDKHDITVFCEKPGFAKVTYVDHSGINGMTVGNVLIGGAVGWAIDSATGSDNQYVGTIRLPLVPLNAPSPAPAAAGKPIASIVGAPSS